MIRSSHSDTLMLEPNSYLSYNSVLAVFLLEETLEHSLKELILVLCPGSPAVSSESVTYGDSGCRLTSGTLQKSKEGSKPYCF